MINTFVTVFINLVFKLVNKNTAVNLLFWVVHSALTSITF